jgi:hypothetical protein
MLEGVMLGAHERMQAEDGFEEGRVGEADALDFGRRKMEANRH